MMAPPTTLALALLFVPAAGCAASGPVEYTVALPAPQTQMVEMRAVVETDGREAIDFVLPSWRPGRYDILDPVGTMRGVRAEDQSGVPLDVVQVAKSRWRVDADGSDRVAFSYRMYANETSRTRHVDDTHAFLSPSTVFVYDPECRQNEVRVHVEAPAGWRVATGLEPWDDDPFVLRAPDYDVLVDSPLEIGQHDVIAFDVDGTPHEIVIWPEGVPHDAAQLTDDFTRIIRTQRDIFGELPYSRYVFLVHVGIGGGGTEHLNSTIMLTSRSALAQSDGGGSSYDRFLGLVSHEFFHTWNVKQLRPAGIHPYDYENENYTDLFWVAEGTTTYYDEITRVRAGFTKPTAQQRSIASAIERDRTRPGSREQSVAASSFNAWTKHNASSPDDANAEVSFYSKGALVSLALDLELRQRTDDAASLDTVMRTMYERFPLSGSGYETADLVAVLDEVSGSSFEAFFERHVNGTDEIPFEALLPVVGLELYFDAARSDEDDSAKPDDGSENDTDADDGDADEDEDEDEDDAPASAVPLKPTLGIRANGSPLRVSSVSSDGPAYAAGIIVSDEIVAVDGRRVRNLAGVLEDAEPGDVLTLHVIRRDELRVFEVELFGVPDGSWKIRRVKDPTDAQKATYATWCGQDWD